MYNKALIHKNISFVLGHVTYSNCFGSVTEYYCSLLLQKEIINNKSDFSCGT
jgi:hypothetical protein